MNKMIVIYTILALLVLSGCAQDNRDMRTIKGIDKSVQKYVTMYETIKGKQIGDIPIGLSNLNGATAGVCYRWSNGYRQILIDREYWESKYTTENERINVVFHELGHCDLNRGHLESYRSNGLPSSLMFPYNLGFSDYDADYYYKELFGRVKSQSKVSDLETSDSSGGDCVRDMQ